MKPSTLISVEEYLRNEATAKYKSEYRAGVVMPVHRETNELGEVVAMAGARPPHNLLVAKLLRLLGNCLEDTDCLVYSSDQLVHIPECEEFVYPDITVVCQSPKYIKSPQGLEALQNPTIIVEVLSKSTAEYDRTEKFRCYRTLPSLTQYVLVSSTEPLIETYTKQTDADHWLLTITNELEKPVQMGDCEFLLQDIYRKIDLKPV